MHLEDRQQAFAEEMGEPLFLNGLRGERAGINHMLGNIEAGKFGLMRSLEDGFQPGRSAQRFLV